MSGDAGRSFTWRMQEVLNRRPSHCWDAERDGAALHWVGLWVNLGSAFENAGTQRCRQVKHTAVSQQPGFRGSMGVVEGQAHFSA